MNLDLIKNEFIKLKKEEFDYIDNVAKISSKKILSEQEKIEIYRKINNYQNKLDELFKKLANEIRKDIKGKPFLQDPRDNIIIDIEVNKNFLNSIDFDDLYYINFSKEKFIQYLGVDPKTMKFKLSLYDILSEFCYYIYDYRTFYVVQNGQRLTENPIYVFSHYIDNSDCGFIYSEDNDHAVYEEIFKTYRLNDTVEILRKEVPNFEKDKTIIYPKRYVYSDEIREIFKEELLDTNNKTVNDCVVATRNRIDKLNYVRSPEYKEKVLLDRINELYNKVKGEFIKKETLYNGDFLEILKETYILPNKKTVIKEKVIKNSGKNSVIIIAINQNKEYIITFQNRIKDKKIAEFPSGYIEYGEDPIEAAKRELLEETGYKSDDLFIVDEVYTSPGIDNSVTYIVVANNCTLTNDKKINSNELISCGLFSEKELKYLVSNNIMNGAINKLAYYNLINNVDDCNATIGNKKIYKVLKKHH